MRAAPLSGAEKLRGKSVFTTFEAARICDVTPVTIQNWIDKGWLRAYRTPGGHRRVEREALLAFLESRGVPHAFPERVGPPRALILNEDPALAASLREALLRDSPGCDVRVARDGFHAGVLYAALRPDVVILDLNHPGVDGFEACRQIRRGEGGGDALVLAIGGRPDGDARERVMSLGAAHCLPKPVDAAMLGRLVREFLSNRFRAARSVPEGFPKDSGAPPRGLRSPRESSG